MNRVIKAGVVQKTHDIMQQTAYLLNNHMPTVEMMELPDDTLMDLQNAYSCLYMAIENAIIRDTMRRRNEEGNKD